MSKWIVAAWVFLAISTFLGVTTCILADRPLLAGSFLLNAVAAVLVGCATATDHQARRGSS